MKNAISEYNKHRVVDRDPSNPDFQTIASKYQVYAKSTSAFSISRSNRLFPHCSMILSDLDNEWK
jgi:hypothetical protein